MKYLILLCSLLLILGCENAKNLAEEKDAPTIKKDIKETPIKDIEEALKKDVEGTWHMLSIADRVLNENESGTITFKFQENENEEHNNKFPGSDQISATVGCNSISTISKIGNNRIKYYSFSETEKGCIKDLQVLHEEMSPFFHKTSQFKFVNSLLILMDNEDEITFILDGKQ